MKKYALFIFMTILMASSCQDDENGTSVPLGQTGPPTTMYIDNVRVTSFPSTDGGAGWDLTSGADMYVSIRRTGSSAFWNSDRYDNVTSGNSYDYNANATISNPTLRHDILIYDHDSTSGDDFMGGVEFTPYQGNNSYPSQINLSAGGVSFVITVDYQF